MAHRNPLRWHRLLLWDCQRGDLIRPTAAPANPRKTPGGIIPLWGARSSRNRGAASSRYGGRHHPGIGGRLPQESAVCATIANCDDYEDIVDWGEANLKFLRGFSDYHLGIPCADWLRSLMNRIDPAVFSGAFRAWVANCWPGRPELVAIDGKTSRRSHNKKTGKGPLHLVSAYATNSRLVLAQEAVDEKENEIVVIPKLLDQLDLDGALVSIDAIACDPAIAEAIDKRRRTPAAGTTDRCSDCRSQLRRLEDARPIAID